MKFRTEIGEIKSSFKISASDRIALIGSCFADNVGERLVRDGFDAAHNPLGPLFNPASIGKILTRGSAPYNKGDLTEHEGIFHCLDFASRYQSPDADTLIKTVNDDYLPYSKAIEQADILIITLGTNKVYCHNGAVAGNCHKLPAKMFEEKYLQADEVAELSQLIKSKKTILTLSPVKYPGEGLAKGFLSKAILRTAIDRICSETGCDYFPAYEIVNEDLRDYRFYAADMRHPSEAATDYIYEKFCETYFSEATMKKALESRKEWLRNNHRPILNQHP